MEAVVEILSELPGPDGRLRVPIHGGNHPRIGLQGLGIPHPLKLSALEHPQKLHLKLRRQGIDLIEKDRPLVGQLESAGPVPHGAGEGAAHMAEELALQHRLRQGAAADLDKGLLSPDRIAGVDGPGNQPFSGTTFSPDENRGLGGRDRLDHGVDLPHSGMLAHHIMEAIGNRGGQFAAKGLVLRHEPPLLADLPDHVLNLPVGQGLGHIVISPQLHRLDRCLDGSKAGDQDHRGFGTELLQALEQPNSIHPRHLQIRYHDGEGALLDEGEGALAV